MTTMAQTLIVTVMKMMMMMMMIYTFIKIIKSFIKSKTTPIEINMISFLLKSAIE